MARKLPKSAQPSRGEQSMGLLAVSQAAGCMSAVLSLTHSVSEDLLSVCWAQELVRGGQKKETDLPSGRQTQGSGWASIPVPCRVALVPWCGGSSWKWGSLGRFGGETSGPGLVAGGGWGEAGAETEGWDVLGCEGLTAPISPRSAPTRTVSLPLFDLASHLWSTAPQPSPLLPLVPPEEASPLLARLSPRPLPSLSPPPQKEAFTFSTSLSPLNPQQLWGKLGHLKNKGEGRREETPISGPVHSWGESLFLVNTPTQGPGLGCRVSSASRGPGGERHAGRW